MDDRNKNSASNSAPPRPFWIPAGVDFDKLPAGAQVALREIIGPAYVELVASAEGALERSAGLTIVHLMWIEVLQQLEFGCEVAGTRSGLDYTALTNYEALAAHLRVAGAKTKMSSFLLRLKSVQAKLDTIRANAQAAVAVNQVLVHRAAAEANARRMPEET